MLPAVDEEAAGRAKSRPIMENINQADDYRRLQELYSDMSDSKLAVGDLLS